MMAALAALVVASLSLAHTRPTSIARPARAVCATPRVAPPRGLASLGAAPAATDGALPPCFLTNEAFSRACTVHRNVELLRSEAPAAFSRALTPAAFAEGIVRRPVHRSAPGAPRRMLYHG